MCKIKDCSVPLTVTHVTTSRGPMDVKHCPNCDRRPCDTCKQVVPDGTATTCPNRHPL